MRLSDTCPVLHYLARSRWQQPRRSLLTVYIYYVQYTVLYGSTAYPCIYSMYILYEVYRPVVWHRRRIKQPPPLQPLTLYNEYVHTYCIQYSCTVASKLYCDRLSTRRQIEAQAPICWRRAAMISDCSKFSGMQHSIILHYTVQVGPNVLCTNIYVYYSEWPSQAQSVIIRHQADLVDLADLADL